MNLEQFLKSKGYNIDDKLAMQPYQEMWGQWFRGNVPSFQNYSIYNGDKEVKLRRFSLNMAKKVCEDFANVLLNEKVQYHIGNETTQSIIEDILDYNDFYAKANQGIEMAYALGEGAFVISVGDLLYNKETKEISVENAKINIDFVSADKIYPLSYNGNEVTECAFATYKTINNTPMCLLSIHKLNEQGNYVIENFAFRVTKAGNLVDISEQVTDAIKMVDTQSDKKWFSIIKPPVTNNIILNSQTGISIFANSIDVLKGIDLAYDSFVNEFVLGRKRIFVASDLLQPDVSTGTVKRVFDTNDIVFHLLPYDENGGDKIKEVDMELRVAEHEQGIQLGLNMLSSKIGFGEERYQFNKNNVSTATQIISENSEMYRTIKKCELLIENEFVDMFLTICYIAKNILNLPVEEEPEITIDFDDSIIEDKAEIKRQAQLEYSMNLIDKVQYFMATRQMTKDQAEQFISEMDLQQEEEPNDEEDFDGEGEGEQNEKKKKEEE